MKLFRLWRGDPEGLERAKRAEADAERHLQEAYGRRPANRRESTWARETRERNHLGDKLQQIMRGTI